ncbi:MAG: DNA translocase FtsK [Oscillospiraceae bacterium]|nr:DNA translocase FtsK [Oscillospiraceae bacterium]
MANSKTTKTKKTSAAKKKNPSPKKNSKKQNLSFYESHRSAIMFVYLIVSLLLMTVAFIPGRNVWASIRGFFFGFFGLGFYLFDIFLLVIGVRVALNSLRRSCIFTTVCAFLASGMFSAVVHLTVNSISAGGKEEFISQLVKAYELGMGFNEGFVVTGGVLGAVFGGGMLHLLGKAAAFVFSVLLLAVFLFLFLNISFSSVSDCVSNAINGSKEKLDESNELRKARRLERQEKREQERLEAEAQLEKERLDENDAFDFSKTQIELDDNMSVRRKKRSARPYNPEERLFTFTENDAAAMKKEKAEREELVDTEDIEPISEKNPDINEAIEAAAGLKTEENELPDGYEEVVDADEADLDAEAQSIVNAAITKADKNARKNIEEVKNYTDESRPKKEYCLPPIDCLKEPDFSRAGDYAAEMKTTAKKLVDTLKSFGVETNLIGVSRGPSVTRYELQPAPGVKINRITNLADDIALNLASAGVRIEAPIPNKSAVGIEIPNQHKSMVTLREIISSSEFQNAKSKLNVALGKDITGNATCTDIAKMPHLLIAGTTGSGKSVCLNCMIVSILYEAKPSEVKLLMIDPKQVEFSIYNGIPHLLVPVISDVRKAAGSLAWAVSEMENRYKAFSACGVRDIKGFNKYVLDHPEQQFMPQIVIFIDELNDLMMVSPKEVEDSICRLAQKARAAGMHLVVATQRPSVDVITGIIKANIPSRLSLFVSSQVDSRTILDTVGAEKLLGNGDMLFNPVGMSKPVRIQGAFLSDEEIENVVSFIKEQEEVEYDSEVMDEIARNAVADNKKKSAQASAGDEVGDADGMVAAAIDVVVECQAASTTLLQRKLRLGYARAARIMDELEQRGIVGPSEGSKPRKVLMTQLQLAEIKASRDIGQDDYDVLSD